MTTCMSCELNLSKTVVNLINTLFAPMKQSYNVQDETKKYTFSKPFMNFKNL